MRHRDYEANHHLLTAFVAGSVAGGVTALLLAPASGRRLRRSVVRTGRRFGRRASDSVESLQERGQSAFEQARESLQEIADEARERARALGRR